MIIVSVSLAEFNGDVHQPDNNLLIFCAVSKEDSPETLAFVNYLVNEMERMRGKKFVVEFRRNGRTMTEEIMFVCGRSTGDQKFIATVLGELNNAAQRPFRYTYCKT